jgi:hypothetical protein
MERLERVLPVVRRGRGQFTYHAGFGDEGARYIRYREGTENVRLDY